MILNNNEDILKIDKQIGSLKDDLLYRNGSSFRKEILKKIEILEERKRIRKMRRGLK
jgi:hypothetical protein